MGGGDAIFVWDFCGGTGVDPEDMVEVGVLRAMREHEARLSALEQRAEEDEDVIPSPNSVLQQPVASQRAGPRAEGATLLLNAHIPVDEALESTVAELKERMSSLELDETGLNIPEGLAAIVEEVGEPSPRKIYSPPLPLAGHIDAEEDIEDEANDKEAPDIDDRDWVDFGGSKVGLASKMDGSLQLTNLIGFDLRAHDHLLWQPTEGRLIYSSGDNVIIDPLEPASAPTYIRAEVGAVSTLALSPSGRFVAVSCFSAHVDSRHLCTALWSAAHLLCVAGRLCHLFSTPSV